MSLGLLKSSSYDWEDNKGYCMEESFSPETYRMKKRLCKARYLPVSCFFIALSSVFVFFFQLCLALLGSTLSYLCPLFHDPKKGILFSRFNPYRAPSSEHSGAGGPKALHTPLKAVRLPGPGQ